MSKSPIIPPVAYDQVALPFLNGYLYVACQPEDSQEVNWHCYQNINDLLIDQGITYTLFNERPDSLAYHIHTLEVGKLCQCDSLSFGTTDDILRVRSDQNEKSDCQSKVILFCINIYLNKKI